MDEHHLTDVEVSMDRSSLSKKDSSEKWLVTVAFSNLKLPQDKKRDLPEDDPRMIEYKRIVNGRKELLETLESSPHLKITTKTSNTEKREYILLDATDHLLEREAERLECNMKFKDSYGGGYGSFSALKKFMFENEPDIFTEGQKIMLLESYLFSPKEDGGLSLDIQKLVSSKIITKYYILHNEETVKKLLYSWCSWRKLFSPQPIEEIKNYFGEEIGMYFVWIGFYIKWLWITALLGIVGVGFWAAGIFYFENNRSRGIGVWSMMIYSVLLSFISTAFIEFWKRKSASCALNWGTSEYEETEIERPDYKGEERKGVYVRNMWLDFEETIVPACKEMKGHESAPDWIPSQCLKTAPINKYYDSGNTKVRRVISYTLLVFWISCVLVVNFGVLSLRLYLQQQLPDRLSVVGSIVGAVCNKITIGIMGTLWRRVAMKLTSWENHRTETEFMRDFTVKAFIFDFANTFSSLYYLAFFKSGTSLFGDAKLTDRCGGWGKNGDYADVISKGCVDELSIQLATLLIVNIFVGQSKELLIPFVKSKLLFYVRRIKSGKLYEKMPAYEKQFYLAEYSGTFDEYSELVIQYGLIFLFAAAFPIAPLLAVLNNIVEIRTDGAKILMEFNRPKYRRAAGIGIWLEILDAMNIMAIITNMLLIGFSYGTLKDEIRGDKKEFWVLVIVVVLEHTLLLIRYTLSKSIPDAPAKITRRLALREYLRKEAIKYSYFSLHASTSKKEEPLRIS